MGCVFIEHSPQKRTQFGHLELERLPRIPQAVERTVKLAAHFRVARPRILLREDDVHGPPCLATRVCTRDVQETQRVILRLRTRERHRTQQPHALQWWCGNERHTRVKDTLCSPPGFLDHQAGPRLQRPTPGIFINIHPTSPDGPRTQSEREA